MRVAGQPLLWLEFFCYRFRSEQEIYRPLCWSWPLWRRCLSLSLVDHHYETGIGGSGDSGTSGSSKIFSALFRVHSCHESTNVAVPRTLLPFTALFPARKVQPHFWQEVFFLFFILSVVVTLMIAGQPFLLWPTSPDLHHILNNKWQRISVHAVSNKYIFKGRHVWEVVWRSSLWPAAPRGDTLDGQEEETRGSEVDKYRELHTCAMYTFCATVRTICVLLLIWGRVWSYLVELKVALAQECQGSPWNFFGEPLTRHAFAPKLLESGLVLKKKEKKLKITSNCPQAFLTF